MVGSTKIEWATDTWNPTTGCSKVSAGCANCYAERDWPRVYGASAPANMRKKYGVRKFTDVMCHSDRIDQPLRWKKPRVIFVNSMSDLFHENIPDEFIDQVFGVMALAAFVRRCRSRDCEHEGVCESLAPLLKHTFQILTKRPERAQTYLAHPDRMDRVAEGAAATWAFGDSALDSMTWPLPNVWLGVSAEDQTTADERIPILLDTPAAVRFVSLEPLLGGIDMRGKDHQGSALDIYESDARLDWVIVGGESGPKARPCDVAWIRSIVQQCKAAGVPAFVKQLGAVAGEMKVPVRQMGRPGIMAMGEAPPQVPKFAQFSLKSRKGSDTSEWPEGLNVREFPGEQT